MNFGMPKLLLIFGVIALFFGGKKIPATCERDGASSKGI